MNKPLILSLVLAALAPRAGAATPTNPVAGLAGPLASLINPQAGRAMHEGSWDRSGGNGDMRGVAPGQTITLLDHKGAGIIRRFWVTIAPRAHKEIHAQAILRMYWDGETNPSVEVPIGAFFGVGFGEQVDYTSLPLNETSGGYNCYWPMPFRTSARWTLTNLSNRHIDAFYYNIDFTGYDKLPDDIRYFHAQFRRENPTTANKNYTILDASGPGHFVGTALFMQNLRGKGLGFLEGDEMIYIDGESKPSIIGTGTEDYFSSGWYYDRGPYSAPFHGVPIKDEKLGRVSTYRWHIEDAMPYQKSIKVTIEHGHANDHTADYSSVAYWYQAEDHIPFPPLPAAADLLPWTPPPPKTVTGAIEGESLVAKAKTESGQVTEQDMTTWPGRWSNDAQLWWQPDGANKRLDLFFDVPEDGQYELEVFFTQAPDYGTFDFEMNGMRANMPVDLYADSVKPMAPLRFGPIWLGKGTAKVTVVNIGKNAKSTGYMFGLDAARLIAPGST
jgi:hypothetical protein